MWLYKGKELTDDMIPEKAQGFLYLMTYKDGRRYLGRKLLTSAKRTQKNKKIIRSRVPSNWKNYWSSSPEILSIIEQEGTEGFTREILIFAFSKSELNYYEEKFLYCVGSMESTQWINSNIRSKVFKRHILDKIDTQQIEDVLSYLKQ